MRYGLILAAMMVVLGGCGGGDAGKDSPGGPKEVIPSCNGDPWTNFSSDGVAAPPADSEAYVVPTATRRTSVAASIDAFQDGSFESALDSAQESGYQLCHKDADVGPLVFWLPETAGEGHARWVVRADRDARPLVVEAPHGFLETDTFTQAEEVFRKLRARALLINGGHRCANQTPSGCTGTTSVCGVTDEPFRESDMAHTVESFFQTAHSGIASAYPTAWVVSLHGMTREGLSLSNGTTDETDKESRVADLFHELDDRFPDERLTTCNAFGDQASKQFLCGTTNVQARQLNDADQPCNDFAEKSSGRFLHLEQNSAIRTDPGKREAVTDALGAVLE